ncbi:UNVERIFIED_CONTAM: hypothetical protein PO554_26570, partial [Klebsiella pneumoniae]
LPIPAPRGRILDKNGEVLVSNKPVYTVQYVEEQGQDIDEEKVADRLAKILLPDGEKIGTDKELLKKTIELRSTLPIAFNNEETNALKNRVAAKLQAVPKQEAVDSMSDFELVKTALYVGLRVRSPFDDNQRKDVIKKLNANAKGAGTVLTEDNTSDLELLKMAISANMELVLTLDKEDRDALIKEVKAQIRKLPAPNELSDKSGMDLLR